MNQSKESSERELTVRVPSLNSVLRKYEKKCRIHEDRMQQLLPWIFDPLHKTQSGDGKWRIPVSSPVKGMEISVLHPVLKVCCGISQSCWSCHYRHFYIMDSLRLASSERQVCTDKISPVPSNSLSPLWRIQPFTSDLYGSRITWASKSYLWLK